MKKNKMCFAFALTILFVFCVIDAQTVLAFDVSIVKTTQASVTKKTENTQRALDNMAYLFQKLNESGIAAKDLEPLRGFISDAAYKFIETIIVIAPYDMSVEEKMSILMETQQLSDNCKLAMGLGYSGLIGAIICDRLIRPFYDFNLGNILCDLFIIEMFIGMAVFSQNNCAATQ